MVDWAFKPSIFEVYNACIYKHVNTFVNICKPSPLQTQRKTFKKIMCQQTHILIRRGRKKFFFQDLSLSKGENKIRVFSSLESIENERDLKMEEGGF